MQPSTPNDFEVIDPSTEEVCAIISLDQSDTNIAEAAKIIFSLVEYIKREKLELLNNLLNIYQNRSSDMAQAISLEMGAPKDWSINEQSQSGEDHIKLSLINFKILNLKIIWMKKSIFRMNRLVFVH